MKECAIRLCPLRNPFKLLKPHGSDLQELAARNPKARLLLFYPCHHGADCPHFHNLQFLRPRMHSYFQ
jgi:hypothetical protein